MCSETTFKHRLYSAIVLLFTCILLDVSCQEYYIQDTTLHNEQRVVIYEVSIEDHQLGATTAFDIPSGWFVVDMHTMVVDSRLYVTLVIERTMSNRERRNRR